MNYETTIKDALREVLFGDRFNSLPISKIEIHKHYVIIQLEGANIMDKLELLKLLSSASDNNKYNSGWVITKEGAQKIFIEEKE